MSQKRVFRTIQDSEHIGTVSRERVAVVVREVMEQQAKRAARRNGAKSGDSARAGTAEAKP